MADRDTRVASYGDRDGNEVGAITPQFLEGRTFGMILAGAPDQIAARFGCLGPIPMDTLEMLFLAQHFRQHYQTVLGSLETWRTVLDWRDSNWIQKEKPWIISGLSS
jgi:hypothetical protein